MKNILLLISFLTNTLFLNAANVDTLVVYSNSMKKKHQNLCCDSHYV